MGSLANHQSTSTTKLLLIGDSGSGKTGALASLAKAGYNLRILDLDNGLDVLYNLLKDDLEALNRVTYETLTDSFTAGRGKPMATKATAWPRAVGLLDHWKVEVGVGAEKKVLYDLGKVTDWTEQDVLVIDSLTLLSNAALRYILALNGRAGQQPWQSDWGEAMTLIENLCAMLYSDAIRCNVIMISHVTFIGGEGEPTKGYPSTLGQKLPPKIGRYFNTILIAKSDGAAGRRIHAKTQGTIESKTPIPKTAKPFYDLPTGLAEFFEAVRKGK